MRSVFLLLLFVCVAALHNKPSKLAARHNKPSKPYLSRVANFKTFDFCYNYENLNTECSQPVPVNNTAAKAPPLKGLKSKIGFWAFKDKIKIRLSKKWKKVSIELAHDLVPGRRHVVMTNRNNGKVFKYEAIRDLDTKKTHTYLRCVKKAKPTSLLEEEQGLEFEDPEKAIPLMSDEDRELNAHIRDMIPGWGHILVETQGSQIDTKITCQTTKHVQGKIPSTGAAFQELFNAAGADKAAMQGTQLVTDEMKIEGAKAPKMLYSGPPNWKPSTYFIRKPSNKLCIQGTAQEAIYPEVVKRKDLAAAIKSTYKEGRQNAKKGGAGQKSLLEKQAAEHMEALSKLSEEFLEEHDTEHISRNKCPKGKWSKRRNKKKFPKFTKNSYYKNPASTQCKSMKHEVVGRTYTDIRQMIGGPMKTIDDYGAKVVKGIKQGKKLEKKLQKISRVMTTLDIPLALLGFLPYVGPAFRTFKKVLKYSNTVLKRVVKKIKKVNKKIKSMRVEQKVCKMRNLNDKLANKMRDVSAAEHRGIKPILKQDAKFNAKWNVKSLKNLCDRIAHLHRQYNNQVSKIKKALNNIKIAMKNHFPTAFFKAIDFILTNPLTRALDMFFGAIGRLLAPFTRLMNKRINVRVPIPGIRHKRVCLPRVPYPCGVKWCHKWIRIGLTELKSKTSHKTGWGVRFPRIPTFINKRVRYPCGANICHSPRKCGNVPYPTVTMKRFGFTVGQIVRGVLNVLGIVMDLLMKAVKKLIPGIPGLNFKLPGTTLPRFSFNVPKYNLKLPRFPSLPSLKRMNTCAATVHAANAANRAIGGKVDNTNAATQCSSKGRRRKRGGKRRASNRKTSTCVDKRGATQCGKWKNHSRKYCSHHKYVREHCQKTCKTCKASSRRRRRRRRRKRGGSRCKDIRSARQCRGWKRHKRRYCSHHTWVRKMCKRTCGVCRK